MEGKCYDLFQKVAKIHDQAHVVAWVWDSYQITPDRKQESIDNLRGKALELKEKMDVRAKDVNDLFNLLDYMEANKRVSAAKIKLMDQVDEITSNLAIHAIADCECTRNILKPIRPDEDLR